MDHRRIWARSRDGLISSLTALGFPGELGEMIAKQLGSPKAIDRMAAYLDHEKPDNLEIIIDEMLAIRSEIDAWKEKKAVEEANARYNEILYYGLEEPLDIRLIGFDLDGTLLTSDKRLTPRTKQVLEECIARGIVVLPATGRPKSGIPQYLRDIRGLKYVMCANGAAVIDIEKDEYVLRKSMSWERVLSLMEELETYGTYYDFFADGRGWCEERFLSHLEDFIPDIHIRQVVRTSRKQIPSGYKEWLMTHQEPVDKVTMFFPEVERCIEVEALLKRHEDLRITSAFAHNIEINDITCNKGASLIGLGKFLGIPASRIMAFGDGKNDVDMIRMAGMGVAMGNAMEPVLEVADYVTKTCDEEGVACAIEDFVLSKSRTDC